VRSNLSIISFSFLKAKCVYVNYCLNMLYKKIQLYIITKTAIIQNNFTNFQNMLKNTEHNLLILFMSYNIAIFFSRFVLVSLKSNGRNVICDKWGKTNGKVRKAKTAKCNEKDRQWIIFKENRVTLAICNFWCMTPQMTWKI